jgi:hypothetical protein
MVGGSLSSLALVAGRPFSHRLWIVPPLPFCCLPASPVPSLFGAIVVPVGSQFRSSSSSSSSSCGGSHRAALDIVVAVVRVPISWSLASPSSARCPYFTIVLSCLVAISCHPLVPGRSPGRRRPGLSAPAVAIAICCSSSLAGIGGAVPRCRPHSPLPRGCRRRYSRCPSCRCPCSPSVRCIVLFSVVSVFLVGPRCLVLDSLDMLILPRRPLVLASFPGSVIPVVVPVVVPAVRAAAPHCCCHLSLGCGRSALVSSLSCSFAVGAGVGRRRSSLSPWLSSCWHGHGVWLPPFPPLAPSLLISSSSSSSRSCLSIVVLG